MKGKGSVYVERADLAERVLLDVGNWENSSVLDAPKSVASHRSVTSSVRSDKPGSMKRFLSEQLAASKEREEKEHDKILKALALQKEQSEKRLGMLSGRVQESTKFLDKVDKELELVDETKRTKTRRQFEDWNSNVHGHIQRTISKEVNKIDAKDLHAKKNQDYNKFLEITNRKPCIFRDIIIEAEYDPLEVNRAGLRAKTPKLKDPTQIDAQKAESENAMLPPKGDGSRPKLCKETLPVVMWAKEKIGATPYGMFAEMMGGGEKVVSEIAGKRSKSSVQFDDFNFPTGAEGRKAVSAEMPPGKPRDRRVFANPSQIYPFHPQVRKELLRIPRPDP